MPSPIDDSAPDVFRLTGAGLPPGRLAELQPRLQALLTDFAHLVELEALGLEPAPAYVVTQAVGDQHE